jgi:hypothetical protein
MIWNGNEWGKNRGAMINRKATITNTEYDISKTPA